MSKLELVKADILTPERIELLKTTICKGSTDIEFELFVNVCKQTGLCPFSNQIFAVKRWDSKEEKNVMTIQVSIDGYRLIADRSGKYEGQTYPQWCGEDGQWVDVWAKPEYPFAARVGVWKTGFREACFGVAKWTSYVQKFKNKKTNEWEVAQFWKKMPELMLSKVAEMLALRKAFPQELAGLEAQDEIIDIPTGDVAVEVDEGGKKTEKQVTETIEVIAKQEEVKTEPKKPEVAKKPEVKSDPNKFVRQTVQDNPYINEPQDCEKVCVPPLKKRNGELIKNAGVAISKLDESKIEWYAKNFTTGPDQDGKYSDEYLRFDAALYQCTLANNYKKD